MTESPIHNVYVAGLVLGGHLTTRAGRHYDVSPTINQEAAMDVHTIIDDYIEIDPGSGRCGWRGVNCAGSAAVRSKALGREFQWCASHFALIVAERAMYERSREGHEEEFDAVCGALHAVYHHLDDGDVVSAVALIERTAERFPECAEMPLASSV